jgi:hypothetical protein
VTARTSKGTFFGSGDYGFGFQSANVVLEPLSSSSDQFFVA